MHLEFFEDQVPLPKIINAFGDTTQNEKTDPNTLKTEPPPIRITTKLPCYVCKKEISEIHHFYDQVSSTIKS